MIFFDFTRSRVNILSDSDIIKRINKEGEEMKLKTLMVGLSYEEYRGDLPEEQEITSVTNDSRKVQEGSLFVAIKGYLEDGHDYLEAARKNGAVAAVVTEFCEDLDIVQIRVLNAREALSMLSAKLNNHPTRKLRMIGITATNGKTTTSYILDHIYSMAGYKTGLVGSVVIKVGERFIHSELTTPESSDLQVIFSEMVEEKIEKTIMEVSSSALELYRVHDVDFDIVAFNNFSREHIDQHGSLEKYYEAKSSLVRNAKEGSFAVLNQDDEATYGLRGETRAHVITFSTKDDSADLYCSDLDLSSGRANFVLKIRQDIVGLDGMIEKGEYPVSLMVPGFHSVVNSLSAMAMALIDGVKIKDVINAVETFGGVERRFQYIYDDEFIIIDDHFANMSNIDMTLESLMKLDYNKLHLVYAIRGNRGTTVNKENIVTLLKWRDKLHMDEIIGTKSEEFVTPKDRVTEKELRVFNEELEKSDLRVVLFEELKESIYYAIDKAEQGDVILLAGSQGMDHGARVALEYIYKKNGQKDKEKLFAPLKGRVSDMA
jgi:UDP-N-acetylmuramoyl-L-alanyl-D-glutamate--2,6-diaminopimelate ligase